jgi:hypothetical protein
VRGAAGPSAVTHTTPPGWPFLQAIDPAFSGLRAQRTSLLSLGDDECRFTVLETDDPLAEYIDKLDQRFVDEPAPAD